MRTIYSFLLMAGISLLPVYLWSSGGMQVSHMVIALGACAYIARRGLGWGHGETTLFLLALFVLLREAVAGADSAPLDVFLPFLYLVFSLLVFTVIRHWVVFVSPMYLTFGLSIAVAIALIGVLVMGYGLSVDSDGARAVGTFNNPNQLGYFAVCAGSLAGLSLLRGHISRTVFVILMAASLFLAIASLSKAAMISAGIGALSCSFAIGRSRRAFLFGGVVVIALLLVAAALVNRGLLDQYAFFYRLSHLGAQGDDSLAERGYSIFNQADALQLIFGFGSAKVNELVGHELHSTIASFFAGYGIVGGLLFVSFLMLWVRRVWRAGGLLDVMIVVMPPMVYGITHNGSRFTIFWVLLAVSWAQVRTHQNLRHFRIAGAP